MRDLESGRSEELEAEYGVFLAFDLRKRRSYRLGGCKSADGDEGQLGEEMQCFEESANDLGFEGSIEGQGAHQLVLRLISC